MSQHPPSPSNAAPAARSAPPRAFARFELRRLLGRSAGTMTWLAFDPRAGHEVMLTLPRVPPVEPAAIEWRQREIRRAARLDHPNLAAPYETGVHEQWPYVAVDRAHGLTLDEWIAEQQRPAPLEAARLLVHALGGLAFAHEANIAHHDLQFHQIVVAPNGQAKLMGFGLASNAPVGEAATAAAQRDAAIRDVLAVGIVLHELLSGANVLDEDDVAKVVERMAPPSREVVRLPWTTPQPIPEGLRAIANRCTATQERQRYQAARTLLRALENWIEVHATDSGDPIALLIDRLRSVGHLPALPGLGSRVARLVASQNERTDELAELLMQDPALSLELLRTVNSAQVRGTQVSGNGPVLTLRRAVALLGIDGVRGAAQSLRAWPGPLNEAGAAAMQRLLTQVRLAGHTAQALRPAGYDPEVVFLVAMLQNLGRLLVQYHFPDEAEQIRQLMLPSPPPPGAPADTPEQPGMGEEAAAWAVLGVEIESLGAAVAKHWGLGEEVQHMMRRAPLLKPVRHADGDADVLRLTASAANEAVDAMTRVSAPKLGAALGRVAQRYARILELEPRDFMQALQGARSALQSGLAAESVARPAAGPGAPAAATSAPTAPTAPTAPPSAVRPSGLAQRIA